MPHVYAISLGVITPIPNTKPSQNQSCPASQPGKAMNLPQICSRWSRICRSMVEREYLPYRLITFQGREFLLIFIFPSALFFSLSTCILHWLLLLGRGGWNGEKSVHLAPVKFSRCTQCITCSWCNAMQNINSTFSNQSHPCPRLPCRLYVKCKL